MQPRQAPIVCRESITIQSIYHNASGHNEKQPIPMNNQIPMSIHNRLISNDPLLHMEKNLLLWKEPKYIHTPDNQPIVRKGLADRKKLADLPKPPGRKFF